MADDNAENNLAIKKTLTQFICILIITVLRTRFAKVLEQASGSKLAATFAICYQIIHCPPNLIPNINKSTDDWSLQLEYKGIHLAKV